MMNNRTPKSLLDDEARLRAMLTEDTESPKEAEALLNTIQALRRWPAPTADTQETAGLLNVLQLEYALTRESRLQRSWRRLNSWWPWLLLRAQLRVVRREIWMATFLVMVLGMLVTLTTYQATASGDTLPFVMFAPLIAALGVAFLYGEDVEQAFELEFATPTSPRLLLLARMTLVFGFNLLLGLLASVVMAVTHTDVSLWPLIASWLAPMAFLSMLAFLLSVLAREPLLGAIVALGVWAVQSLHWFTAQTGTPVVSWLDYFPDLLASHVQPYLLILALTFGLVALWIVERDENRVGGRQP